MLHVQLAKTPKVHVNRILHVLIYHDVYLYSYSYYL